MQTTIRISIGATLAGLALTATGCASFGRCHMASGLCNYHRVAVIADDPVRGDQHPELVRMIEDTLIGELSLKSYDVVDRTELERVLDEKEIQRSGLTTNEGRAAEFGAWLNAEAILVVKVTDVRTVDNPAKRVAGFLGDLLNRHASESDAGESVTDSGDAMNPYEARIRVALRLIDVNDASARWACSTGAAVPVEESDEIAAAYQMVARNIRRCLPQRQTRLAVSDRR